MKIKDTVYYFDGNHRVYLKNSNGFSRSGPVYAEHFRPIKITAENDKEFICDYGVINKRSNLYKVGNDRRKVFTEKTKKDMVYLNDNSRRISELVRELKSAETLKDIEKLLLFPHKSAKQK